MIKQKYLNLILAIFLSFSLNISLEAKAQVVAPSPRQITFPVIGKVNFSDDFGDPRTGHSHEGNDLMGKKLMPLVAAVDGTVSFVNYPEATWGYAVGIKDKDGYEYWYLHINNDNPGTDDDKGDGFHAYAVDIQPGNKVVKGQLIGFMGDSGNAETTSPHLHFEIHDPSGQAFDPYASLKSANYVTTPVADYPQVSGEILPFANFTGGANIVAGNLDTDAAVEVVAGAEAGGGPLVRTFKKDGTSLSSFYAYDQNFRGGVDVATGDVDGDGVDEIITAPGFGGGPHIKIYKANGTLVKEFFAYDTRFHGGVKVTSADLDGDGKAEIITVPGKGGGPDVRVFSPAGQIQQEFMAYDPAFHGGLDVTAVSKKISPAGVGMIITAPGKGGGPHVKVFSSLGVLSKEFMAYDPAFHGGVHLSSHLVTGLAGPQILTIPASEGGPNLKAFDMQGVENKNSFAAFEPWWRGGYDVSVSSGSIYISSITGRRASVRSYNFSDNNNGFRNR